MIKLDIESNTQIHLYKTLHVLACLAKLSLVNIGQLPNALQHIRGQVALPMSGLVEVHLINTRTDGLALTFCSNNLAALCPVMSLLLDLQLSVVLLSIFNIRFSQALIPASTIFCLAC